MTKELDRRFRHVGRIKRSWGTNHKPTIRRMEEMMDGLMASGRLDILRALRDKQYTPLEVYSYYRVNNLDGLPTAATLAPLKESMEKWIAKKECSESHRRSLNQSLRHLLQLSHSERTTVSALPSLVGSLREKMQGKHPRSFNLARAAAQAFAKTTAGRNSKLWADISAVEVLKVKPQRIKHPLTYPEMVALAVRMDDGALRLAAWTMALTGMGPEELYGEWERKHDRIVIHGTKRKARERFVPIPFIHHTYLRPKGSYKVLRRALRDASDGLVRPYDLRRTYANWLEASGIPRTRRRLYMGHSEGDVTDKYEWHEVEAFLIHDAKKIATYLESQDSATWGTPLKLEKA